MFIFVPLSLRTQALSSLDSKSVGQIIQSYVHKKQLGRGKELHAQLLRSKYPITTFVTNHLINLYSKCGAIEYAQNLLEKMPKKNLVSWSSMITGFSQNSRHLEALKVFSLMRVCGENPSQFALASVAKACVSLRAVEAGRQVHCLALKQGIGWDIFFGTGFADMYSKSDDMVEEMPCRDAVLSTEMINGYVKNGEFEASLVAFRSMSCDGILIDPSVLRSTLSACASVRALEFGKCLHSILVKSGFEMEIAVGNALVDMYSKSGDVESASGVFVNLSDRRNVVSFTSMIRGYGEKGQLDKAFSVFVELRREGIDPNEYTFSSLIKACANRPSLKEGAQLHAQVAKLGFKTQPYISSGLIDMYGKCGLLDHSNRLFGEIRNPTEIAWNSLLSVSARHGLGKEVVGIFEKMVLAVKPNAIVFTALLLGCSNAGLVNDGLKYFDSMEKKYGVVPREPHYNCVIDMLSRAGRVNEAVEFIKSMPFEPNGFGWSSFLGACTVRGDAERVKFAAEKLIELEPRNTEALSLLADLYAKEGEFEKVRWLKARMRKGNKQELHSFSSADVENKACGS